MSIDVDECISNQITDELDGGARSRLKPRNAASAKERVTHPFRGTSRADVKGVSDAAA